MSERPSFVSRRSLSHDPSREKPNLLDLKITTHIAQLETTYASTLARLSSDAALNFHQRDLIARPEDYALPAHLDDSHRRMHVVLDRIDQWLEDNICEDIAVLRQQKRFQDKQQRLRELGRKIQEEEREIARERRQMATERRGAEYERHLEKGAVRIKHNPELERSRNRFLNAKKDFDKQRKEIKERRHEAMALV
jgi:hypothetical protein